MFVGTKESLDAWWQGVNKWEADTEAYALKKFSELDDKLRQLILYGYCDDDSAEKIRDKMDRYWHAMSDADRNNYHNNFYIKDYDQYLKTWNDLNSAIESGNGNTNEADKMRWELELYWFNMSEEEQEKFIEYLGWEE